MLALTAEKERIMSHASEEDDTIAEADSGAIKPASQTSIYSGISSYKKLIYNVSAHHRLSQLFTTESNDSLLQKNISYHYPLSLQELYLGSEDGEDKSSSTKTQQEDLLASVGGSFHTKNLSSLTRSRANSLKSDDQSHHNIHRIISNIEIIADKASSQILGENTSISTVGSTPIHREIPNLPWQIGDELKKVYEIVDESAISTYQESLREEPPTSLISTQNSSHLSLDKKSSSKMSDREELSANSTKQISSAQVSDASIKSDTRNFSYQLTDSDKSSLRSLKDSSEILTRKSLKDSSEILTRKSLKDSSEILIRKSSTKGDNRNSLVQVGDFDKSSSPSVKHISSAQLPKTSSITSNIDSLSDEVLNEISNQPSGKTVSSANFSTKPSLRSDNGNKFSDQVQDNNTSLISVKRISSIQTSDAETSTLKSSNKTSLGVISDRETASISYGVHTHSGKEAVPRSNAVPSSHGET